MDIITQNLKNELFQIKKEISFDSDFSRLCFALSMAMADMGEDIRGLEEPAILKQAQIILCKILADEGHHYEDIANFLGKNKSTVYKNISDFDQLLFNKLYDNLYGRVINYFHGRENAPYKPLLDELGIEKDVLFKSRGDHQEAVKVIKMLLFEYGLSYKDICHIMNISYNRFNYLNSQCYF